MQLALTYIFFYCSFCCNVFPQTLSTRISFQLRICEYIEKSLWSDIKMRPINIKSRLPEALPRLGNWRPKLRMNKTECHLRHACVCGRWRRTFPAIFPWVRTISYFHPVRCQYAFKAWRLAPLLMELKHDFKHENFGSVMINVCSFIALSILFQPFPRGHFFFYLPANLSETTARLNLK